MRQDVKNKSSAFELPKNKMPLAAIASVFICGLVIFIITLMQSKNPSLQNKSSMPLLPRNQPTSTLLVESSLDQTVEPDAGPSRLIPKSFIRRISSRELLLLQRRNGGLIKSCYDRAARHDSTLIATKAAVTVDLAGGGKVKAVNVAAGDDQSLEGCLRRAISHWSFSNSLMAQQVTFPIVFQGR